MKPQSGLVFYFTAIKFRLGDWPTFNFPPIKYLHLTRTCVPLQRPPASYLFSLFHYYRRDTFFLEWSVEHFAGQLKHDYILLAIKIGDCESQITQNSYIFQFL